MTWPVFSHWEYCFYSAVCFKTRAWRIVVQIRLDYFIYWLIGTHFLHWSLKCHSKTLEAGYFTFEQHILLSKRHPWTEIINFTGNWIIINYHRHLSALQSLKTKSDNICSNTVYQWSANIRWLYQSGFIKNRCYLLRCSVSFSLKSLSDRVTSSLWLCSKTSKWNIKLKNSWQWWLPNL